MIYFKITTYSPIRRTSSCPHERKQERKCSWGHEPVPSSTILLKGEPQRTFQTQR